jgi:SAM-dependent methyltransferase
MADAHDYISINKALWDEKTRHHIVSGFYRMDEFLSGRSSLNEVELGLLGNVQGRSVLHLQCHFGQDTLSLSRMGAKATGVDFSEVAIAKARELNEQLGLDARFVCADIYDLPRLSAQQYDVVLASYGTIGWLPDMQRWAQVVAHSLKPGGIFVFVEFHPVVWMFDPEFQKISYSYFNKEAIVETNTGTYADRKADMQGTEIGWNHSLAEVMQGLMDHGLDIVSFHEYDHAPYNCFRDMVEVAPGRYAIKGLEDKLPMIYALKAKKCL